VYFLKAVDAHTRKNFCEAYKFYNLALKAKPDLAKAEERIKELETEARNLYEAAYVLKSGQPEKAIQNCKNVLCMVRPEAYAYGRCKKLLSSMQSTEEGGGGSDDKDDF
jgi:hypothetical protein